MEFPFRTDSFLVYRFVKVYFQKSSRIFMDLNLKKKKKKNNRVRFAYTNLTNQIGEIKLNESVCSGKVR